ncbi:MAG: S1C family serine protease [Candidatus Zixiibacteriota bacterium]
MSTYHKGFLVLSWILAGILLWGCSSQKNNLKSLEQGIEEVLSQAGPSVVSISVKNQELSLEKVGSGVIIDDQHVLTIENLLQNADEITIKLQNGEEITDSNIFISGCDFETNLSLLHVEGKTLKSSKMAKEIKNGCLGIVLGNTEYSRGLQVNLGTIGISWIGGVDGYDDNLLVLTSTHNALYPGTPVFNCNAELIGLVEGKIEGEEQVVLLVPATTISEVSQILKRDGEIKRGWVGIISNRICKKERVVISDVIEGSPAHRAGLQKGDVVIACDGKEVYNGIELKKTISKFQKGILINLKIQRDGKELIKKLTIDWAQNLPRKRRCPNRSI